MEFDRLAHDQKRSYIFFGLNYILVNDSLLVAYRGAKDYLGLKVPVLVKPNGKIIIFYFIIVK